MTERQDILFVCTANICRSPMAEAIFNELARERGLPLSATSAGVAAMEGYEMAANAREALYELGVHPGKHSARRVSGAMIESSDLVLAMGPSHALRMEKDFGEHDKIKSLTEYAGGLAEEIPDPYGLTLFAYRASARQIHEYVELALDRISRECGV